MVALELCLARAALDSCALEGSVLRLVRTVGEGGIMASAGLTATGEALLLKLPGRLGEVEERGVR